MIPATMTALAPLVDALQSVYLGNSVQRWAVAAATSAIIALVLLVARRVLVSRLGALAERTPNQIDDLVVALIAQTKTWVLVALALYYGTMGLSVSARIMGYVTPAAKLVMLWQFAIWGTAAVVFLTKHHLSRRTTESDRTSVAMISAIGVAAKVLLWILVIITAMTSVFGIAITPLITGLGVSGIAVALAVQNILGDLLAALAIVFDKPFDVGDNIGVDTITGIVEHIGLKTTRIRSATGEQIIIGNGDLLKSRLRNFRRMSQRRVLFNLDVTYDTPTEILATLPGIVEAIVRAQAPVKFDRSHVASFGESAIRIETVYFVLDPDYKKYMDIQQSINLEVLRRFATQSVKFAFPTQTVYHEGPLAKDLNVGNQPQTSPPA